MSQRPQVHLRWRMAGLGMKKRMTMAGMSYLKVSMRKRPAPAPQVVLVTLVHHQTSGQPSSKASQVSQMTWCADCAAWT